MKNKGFTLIELLAVIVIMGILMILAIPNIQRVMENARKDTFLTISKEVVNEAEKEWMSNNDNKTFCKLPNDSGSTLAFDNEKDLYYYVVLNDKGKVNQIFVYNTRFLLANSDNAGINLENVDKQQVVKKVDISGYDCSTIGNLAFDRYTNDSNNHGGTIGDDGISFQGGSTVDTANFLNLGLRNYDFGTDISVVVRAKPDKYKSGTSAIITNWECAGIGLYYRGQGNLYFQFYNTVNYKTPNCANYYTRINTGYKLELNTFYTIVATYDSGTAKVYVNGAEISSQFFRIESGNYNIRKSSMQFVAGGNPNATNGSSVDRSESGGISITDAIIFDEAITSEQVSKYFSNNIVPLAYKTELTPLASYKFGN